MLKKKYDFDLIVLGSGSGGTVGAHLAAKQGKKVAIFENHTIGGECPNWACVPTKALLHAAEIYKTVHSAKKYGTNILNPTFSQAAVKKWKDLVVHRTGTYKGKESLEEKGIKVFKQKAEFKNSHEVKAGDKAYSAKHFLIATGSDPFIPPIEGLKESGFATFKDLITFNSIPKTLFILGGGAVGCEFAQIFSTFGSQVIMSNRSRLLGNEDVEVSDLVTALFEKSGISVLSGSSVTKVSKEGSRKKIHYELNGKAHTKTVDEILIATGKKPTINFAPENAGLKLTLKKRLVINKHLQTNVHHIYAAGDVVGPLMLTHTAQYQSHIAVTNMFSRIKILPKYDVVPRCVFITPEVASVGITQEQAAENKIATKTGIIPISIFGRANTSDSFNGFVKIIADKNERIIGGSIVSSRAGEMIHEIALAIKLKAKKEDLSEMIHAYPTFSQAIKVAAHNIK